MSAATAPPPRMEAHNHFAHQYGWPIDPGQQAIGLSPITSHTMEHGVDVGPPEFLTADVFPPPLRLTQVAVVTPLMTVVQVIGGVAVFGTNGGRAVIP